MAVHRSGGKPDKFRREDFFYDPQKDVYICPAGELLDPVGKKLMRSRQGRTFTTGRKPPRARAVS
jgi:hypothetical protein